MECSLCHASLSGHAERCPRCGTSNPTGVTATLTVPDAPIVPSAPLGTGEVVAGRFRIVALACRGGMGDVYRALDTKLDQFVALKCLPGALAEDGERLQRLLGEVRVARQISHPNVCRVYDVAVDGSRHFLAMEWIDGEDLGTVLARGRLAPDHALAIARQLCAGLAAVHERGVIHRDLKPANVLLDGRGVAHIADFGLAEVGAARHGWTAREGTPAFMAPEQLDAREVTARSDIYALGLLLYELFAGRPPFEGRTVAELRRAQEMPPPPPSSIAPNVDRAVDAVILRCLAVDPARRPATALDVAAALPGGTRFDEALAAAQRRADRIAAFREELTELRRSGVLELDDAELDAMQRYHDGTLRELVLHFDVDVSERGKALSLGMRLVSMLGAVALAASVVYFFYSFWGSLAVASQVAILTAAPIALAVAAAAVARREPGGHFSTMIALAAVASVLLDLKVLGSVLGLGSSPLGALVCGVFALLLAYGLELRVPFAVGVLATCYSIAGALCAWSGGPWDVALERPETLFPAGALCLVVATRAARSQPPGFVPILGVLGLTLLLVPTLPLGVFPWLSVLPLPATAIELGYEFAGLAGGAAALFFGIQRASKELAYGGAVFLLAWIDVLLSHWLWDVVPRYLFFFMLALVAVAALAVLKRVRARLVAPPGGLA